MQVRQAAWMILIATAIAGCAHRIDMAGAKEPIAISYTVVREESRLYPDYGTIGASILTDDASAKPAKKGKP